ncbi:uncharacterized protein LOC114538615 [Dendronephthya gigantea]|uniref:uncharacterized protein LOC114538615 n=1 Tax=Dendronephthya gigantea TaxID=151771 RepID=UPI00106AEC20|nr:uncharacterized protein LOC114538615 [Dendronephthya gigantea]
MFRGEIYGYAHYLHTQYLLPRHVKFLWQDVICLYWPWAVSNTPRRLLKALDMAPALSVMHGKSHSWNCQFTWGGRWQDGAANGTGEEAEQVNSYISRLGSTTKRMSAAGREEALTEHVLGWNKRKVLNMPKYLRMRYAKTAKTLKEKQKELEETLVDFGLQGKEEKEILEWKSTVENFARADGKSEQEYGDAENYFILYHQIRDATLLKSFVEGGDRQTRDLLGNVELHSTVESKTSQLCSLQQQLSKIKEKFQQVSEEKLLEKGKEELILKSILKLQRKAEIIYFSIQRRARDISKVADRSKMRSSMRKKMSNERKNLKAVVDKLNAFGRSSVSLEEVLEGDFPWSDSDKEKAFDSIPIRTKASIVDKFVAVQRLTEEQDLLIGEMVNFMAYYRDNVLSELDTQQKGIKEMIESILNPDLIEEERVAQGLPEIDVKRYQIRRETISTLKGKLAMCNAGTWFAKLQLQNGMRNFRDLENVELQQYEDVDAEEEAEVSEGESSSDDEENKMDE